MKSSRKSTKTNEEFVSEVRKIHGDKYDYSKVEYINNHTKVIIICPEHGEFKISPSHLREGSGCKECFKEKQSERKTFTPEQFLEKARKIHGNRYDYSQTKYRGYRYDIKYTCPEHGDIIQNAGDHLRGCGCKECGKIRMWDNRGRVDNEGFVEKSKLVHGDRYGYEKVEYVNAKTPVTIICKKHGEFQQTPSNHLLGCGCPCCFKSKMVNDIVKILLEKGIKYTLEQTFDWLKINQNKLRLDIFLEDYNIAIECQGKQHFEPIEFWGGVEQFEKQKFYDETKLKLCTKNKIKVLYYTNINEIKTDEVIYNKISDLIKQIK